MILNQRMIRSIKLLFLFCTFQFAVIAQSDEVLTEAEQMPYFTGCSNKSSQEEKRDCSNKNLVRFISNQLVYPSAAREKGIQGTVYVSFVVNENGEVSDPKIIRDIGEGCGAAAIDVVKSMPRWEPAINKGEKVSVRLNRPVRFYFTNDEVTAKSQGYQINWGSLASASISKEDIQEQLDKKILVRDPYGDEKPVVELIFSFEKKRSYLEGSSAGKINNDMKKVIERCKKGGTFMITAVIQVKGELIYVKRSFEII